MNQVTPAQPTLQGSGGLSLTPGDVLFILSRHKKKIVLFVLLGMIAGGCVYKFWPQEFYSSAQLLVRYVKEKRDVVDSEQETEVTTTTSSRYGFEHVLQTEVAIISSLDLAREVARRVGPETIIPDPPDDDGAPIEARATSAIAKGTKTGTYSNVIEIRFSHEDAGLTQQVLQTIIDTYLEKHVEIHRSTEGTFETYLIQQTDQLKAKLNQTETELLNAHKRAEVIDMEQAKETLATEIARIEQTIFQTEVEIAESSALLDDLNVKSEAAGEEETEGDVVAESAPQSEESIVSAVEDYENTRTALEILRSRERELLMSYTEANSLVKGVRVQIKQSEEKLKQIEMDNPGVIQPENIANTGGPRTGFNYASTINAEQTRVNALNAKLDVLKRQRSDLVERRNQIESVEVTVSELKRRKELEAANYQNFLSSLERSRLEEALSSGTINNISVIQSPSPAIPSVTMKDKIKYAGGAAVAVILISVAWAFLTELVIDTSIKRPIEIRRDTGLPLFMTLPDSEGKAFRRLTRKSTTNEKQMLGKRKTAKKGGYQPKSRTLQAAAKTNPDFYGTDNEERNGEITPWNDEHPLHNYFDALRDRVISFFESKNLQHKPKLIGLTGLGENPGVSTIASGVAASLSKTEGGNVLLVDMTLGKESAQQFYKGEEVTDIEGALESPSKAQLRDNLHVVAEGSNGYKLPSVLPSRFNSIIPKLKASDYDYIVFDMPAVSPISATPRLASYMDVTLMVIEAEKTGRDVIKQATDLLADSKAHLGAILNKTKSYGRKQLEQDFIGLS